jgi:sugar lactone lactonase YvrE
MWCYIHVLSLSLSHSLSLSLSLAGVPTVQGYDGDGALATNGHLWSPFAIWVDAGGNKYFTDLHSCTVRKIGAATGFITTIVGIPRQCGSTVATGPGPTVKLNKPYGITGDNAGHLYIADAANNLVRQYTIATQAISASWDGSTFTGANDVFNFPTGLAFRGANLYIAQQSANTIRKLNVGTQKAAALYADDEVGSAPPGPQVTMRKVKGLSLNTLGTMVYIADTLDREIYSFSTVSRSLTRRRLDEPVTSIVGDIPTFFAAVASILPVTSTAVGSLAAPHLYLTLFLVLCVFAAFFFMKQMNKKSLVTKEKDQEMVDTL